MIDLEGRMRGIKGGEEGKGAAQLDKKIDSVREKGWVEGWLEEGEKKVEWVGGRYGILGFVKKEKGVQGRAELEGGKLVQTTTTSTGDLGKGVAGDVANALGAYMIVKVSILSYLPSSFPFV